MSATPGDVERWRASKYDFEYEDQTGRQAGGPFSEFDSLGRKQPNRLGAPFYLLLIAKVAPTRVRRVPAAAITEEGDDDDGGFSCVTCPCGARPIVRSRLGRCTDCERWYVRVELGAVWVAYGEMPPPPVPSS